MFKEPKKTEEIQEEEVKGKTCMMMRGGGVRRVGGEGAGRRKG